MKAKSPQSVALTRLKLLKEQSYTVKEIGGNIGITVVSVKELIDK